MINSIRSKHSHIVTQISTNEFLIEGNIEAARLGFQDDDSLLTFADIEGGPFVHIGQDFFGRGKIKTIENMHDDNGYLILKIIT